VAPYKIVDHVWTSTVSEDIGMFSTEVPAKIGDPCSQENLLAFTTPEQGRRTPLLCHDHQWTVNPHEVKIEQARHNR